MNGSRPEYLELEDCRLIVEQFNEDASQTVTQDMRIEGLVTMVDVEQWPEIKGEFHANPR